MPRVEARPARPEDTEEYTVENAAVALSWSGGKDSALALAELRASGVHVVKLLVNVVDCVDRVSMHEVRVELVHRQAAALGLACHEIRLPRRPSNAEYDAAIAAAMKDLRAERISGVAFGDLHLADVRDYREQRFAELGIEALFPLWGRDTSELMRAFLGRGYRAVVVCVDTEQIDASFCGRHVDERLLTDLPPGADPAGENGEYHTFVFGGPGFEDDVAFRAGHQMTKGGRFRYQDLMPG